MAGYYKMIKISILINDYTDQRSPQPQLKKITK